MCFAHLSYCAHYVPPTKCVTDTCESSIYTCVIMCVTHLSHCTHYVVTTHYVLLTKSSHYHHAILIKTSLNQNGLGGYSNFS